MIRPVIGMSCALLALAACETPEASRSLGLPSAIPMDQAADLYPDYATDINADRGIADYLSENCSTLSFHAARDVSQGFSLSERLDADGFSRELFEDMPEEIGAEIDAKIRARVQQKYREMGMTSSSQSCSTGRRQIAQETFLGSLLIDDRSTS